MGIEWPRTFHVKATASSLRWQGLGTMAHSHLPTVTRLGEPVTQGGRSASSRLVKSALVQGEEVWLWERGPTPSNPSTPFLQNSQYSRGKETQRCSGSREQKWKERWQISDEQGTHFRVFPMGSPSGQSPSCPLSAPGRSPQAQRPFSSGSSVGQGLLHAKEKRNLLAEYFLDILQDARPP